MIAVIDYKAGNLASVLKAFQAVADDVVVTDDPAVVLQAARVVLPGVGHFSATQRLDQTGLTTTVREVIAQGTPFLGICVGLQWLLMGSEESPEQPGLGYFKGQCRRFPLGSEKVPHVGWDAVALRQGSAPMRLFEGVRPGEMFYFTHSYFVPQAITAPDAEATLIASTHYIEPFAAALEHRNVMGVQFHPEKSGAAGLKILENFVKVSA